MPEEARILGPAYYATRARGWRRDMWAVLHPPYTAWHLSYVVIGAGLAPSLDVKRLAATVLAFFLAVGISAHALDELRGRPLQTDLPAKTLWAAAILGLVGAVGLGLAGVFVVGPGLLPFIAAGVLFVFAYNLELLGGRLHGDFWFALSWGAFPVLTAYFAQTGRLSFAAVAVADRKSTRLNSSHVAISYAVLCMNNKHLLARRQVSGFSGMVSFEVRGGAREA